MLKLILCAASTALFLTLAACSSGDANDSATDDSSEELKSLGKMCGGIAGLTCHSKKLVCKITSHHPDASGTCVKVPAPGTEGGLCGGFAGIQCHQGLGCEFDDTTSSGPPPGAVGLPLPPHSSGPPAGTMGLPLPDASGTCVKNSGPPPGTMGLPLAPH